MVTPPHHCTAHSNVLNNPFQEEILPEIQPEPPLVQLEGYRITTCLDEKWKLKISSWLIAKGVEKNRISGSGKKVFHGSQLISSAVYYRPDEMPLVRSNFGLVGFVFSAFGSKAFQDYPQIRSICDQAHILFELDTFVLLLVSDAVLPFEVLEGFEGEKKIRVTESSELEENSNII
ncbi:hypothetical protein WISP_08150 [Willisornis vidua]|uniref:Uncharacterized protein n=1 Tax=Willisornis vidua TaxID=1566151 RepID=A0ABQ9DXY7_9PASS|nr:hypothetical protein WISP_08150 [Willisornis vidua]